MRHKNQAECLACHKPLDDRSYTFTIEQLAEAKWRAPATLGTPGRQPADARARLYSPSGRGSQGLRTPAAASADSCLTASSRSQRRSRETPTSWS